MAAAPRYFWDTFALVERQRGSDAYAPYAQAAVFTHQMNVYEFVAAVLRDFAEPTARHQVLLPAPNPIEAETDDLFAASRFRAKHRVSYVDALGFVLAQKHDMRFLTGDRAFKSVDGVE